MSLAGALFPRELQAKEIFYLGSRRMDVSVAETTVASVECVPSKPTLNFSQTPTKNIGRFFRLLFAALQHKAA